MWLGSGARIAILQVLLNKDCSALELVDSVRKSTNGKVRIAKAGIYTTLHRMERTGLIKGYYRNEDSDRRRGHPRRYYEIRFSGRRLLDRLELIREVGLSAGI
jgi:DNA-binding PadR family transcriptional regulator